MFNLITNLRKNLFDPTTPTTEIKTVAQQPEKINNEEKINLNKDNNIFKPSLITGKY